MNDRIAAAGCAVSGSLACLPWFVPLMEILQVLATVVAIAAGISSLVYYVRKTRK